MNIYSLQILVEQRKLKDATNLSRFILYIIFSSHYYINYVTIETINQHLLNRFMSEGDLVELLSLADEFSQLKIRDDELDELDVLLQ